MKKCSTCGAEFEDQFLFCEEDGTSLFASDSQSPAPKLFSEAPAEISLAPDAKPGLELDDSTPFQYCLACERQYPLTFSECPLDGQRLTRAGKRVTKKISAKTARVEAAPGDQAARVAALQSASEPSSDDHTSDDRTMAARATQTAPVAYYDTSGPDADDEASFEASSQQSLIASQPSLPEYSARAAGKSSGVFPPVEANGNLASGRRSHRVAATVIAAALLAFALLSLYALMASGPRKPNLASQRQVAHSEADAQASVFIPTPQAARDYEEEPQSPDSIADESNDPAENSAEKKDTRNPVAASKEQKQTTQGSRDEHRPASEPQSTGVKSPPLPDPSTFRNSDARVSASLIRARARQMPSGVHYDLTFTMQEQAGRFVRWNRLSITTRSANGLSRAEAVAFPHRLGPGGMLTFTVSVEMQGASDSDRRGRVICTGFGVDDRGNPLRASFGANLAP